MTVMRRYKENMVIDNLDDIEPCRVDCDKDGGNTGEDFAFFGNMLALNVSFQRPFALPWHLSAQSLACLSLFPSSLSLACSVSTSLPVWGGLGCCCQIRSQRNNSFSAEVSLSR